MDNLDFYKNHENYDKNPYDTYQIFYLIDKLGLGSSSSVYKCQHLTTKKYYAVKIVNYYNLTQVMKEPLMLESVQRPHIIKQLEYYIHQGKIYLILELAKHDLCDFINNAKLLRAEPLIYNIFKQMVAAVKECHNHQIVHRDIKLENFLVTHYCSGLPYIVLCDFGYAANQPADTFLSDFPGSLPYAAPELMKGIPYNGYKSDVWALGVCLYYLYHGQEPFKTAEDIIMIPPSIDTDISPNLKELIAQCLNKDCQNRITLAEVENSAWMNQMKNYDIMIDVEQLNFKYPTIGKSLSN